MTFEVTRQAEIRNSCALIRLSDGLLLTTRIGMSTSGGLAITGQFVSVGAMMQSNFGYLRVNRSASNDCSDGIFVLKRFL